MSGLGRTLADARVRAGLSQRQLAARMGVSWVTVNGAEAGRDVRRATLQQYLRALPELASDDLFGTQQRGGGPATARSVWSCYRALFGVEASEISKVVDIHPNGDQEYVVETTGLRSLRADLRDLRLLVGQPRAVLHGSRTVMRSVEALRDDFTTRVTGRPGSHVVHQFKFPRQLAQRGLTYSRHHFTEKCYHLTSRQAAAATGGQPPFVEGTSQLVTYPVRRLRLVVRFPGRYWPREVRPFVWPTVQVPDPDLPDLTTVLEKEGAAPRLARADNTVTMRVELPLIGVKYGIGWELP